MYFDIAISPFDFSKEKSKAANTYYAELVKADPQKMGLMYLVHSSAEQLTVDGGIGNSWLSQANKKDLSSFPFPRWPPVLSERGSKGVSNRWTKQAYGRSFVLSASPSAG